MDALHLVPASALSMEQMTTAFNRAFEGYIVPLKQTPESLRGMVHTNDIELDASVVALGPDDAPVGIGLLAIRDSRAWVGGMGLAPEWRGQGHGAAVLAALIERARTAGVARIQLEVLEENVPAHRLYERLGFVDVRPLLIYNGQPSLPHGGATAEADEEVRVLPADEALATFDAMHAASLPCWQRELPSLHHMAGGLHARGLFGPDGSLRAYVLFSRTGSGIAVLDAGTGAPTAAERARHVGALVRALTEHAPRSALRAINVPPGDPLGDVMDALGCAVASRQREMALPLIG